MPLKELNKTIADNLTKKLGYLAESHENYYKMPFVAFAYDNHIMRAVNKGGEGPIKTDLTHCEDWTSDVKLWIGIFQTLRNDKADPEIDTKDMRYHLEHLVFDQKQDLHLQGMLFVSVGASPDYGKKDQRDTVDAMYNVDRWGIHVLQAGAMAGRKPIWGRSNYNFNGINSIMNGDSYTSEFEGMMGRIEKAAKAKKPKKKVKGKK